MHRFRHMEKQHRLALAFALLAFIATPVSAATWTASAAKWVNVQTRRNATSYIDAGSIRARGNIRETWQKDVHDVADPRSVTTDITHWEYDCAKRKAALTFSEGYLKGGTSAGGLGIPVSQRIWDAVLPTSPAAAMLQFACSH